MAYTQFNPDTPDPTTQDGTDCFESMIWNFNAVMNAVAVYSAPGWETVITYTGENPTNVLKTHVTSGQQVMADLTWVGTNPNTITYKARAGEVSPWDTMGVQTLTFDLEGKLISTSWSL